MVCIQIKKLFKEWKVWLLIITVLASLIAIHPAINDGVTIRFVKTNTSASNAKLTGPLPTTQPVSRERIISVDNIPISTEKDYYSAIEQLKPNTSIFIKTNKALYKLKTQEDFILLPTNETKTVEVNKTILINKTINGTLQEVETTIKEKQEQPIFEKKVLGTKDIGISVYDAPKTNIRLGFDLQGGTRVILQPDTTASTEEIDLTIDSLKERLNVFGLTDVTIRPSKDLEGNKFISVEIAGLNKEEVVQLLSTQGKFEAKIQNKTTFTGKEVTYVCRTADCSGIDPQRGCGRNENSFVCSFSFAISLSPEAAQSQAESTKKLTTQGEYLSAPLDLYLDNVLVDSLQISSGLKGRKITDIRISGSGQGATMELAQQNTLQNMKQLQTILSTGSLPFKLNIVKIDAISPVFGKEIFLKNAIIIGIISLFLVSLIIFMVYRNLIISLSMIISMLSELIIILGFASLIKWNLDLAAIAGIIVSIGTGVDDIIVIADETLKGQKIRTSWRERMKRAFFIVFGSYFTTLAALVPLWFAGAGILRGFSFVTITGITIGVLIVRPAYAKIIETLIKDEE